MSISHASMLAVVCSCVVALGCGGTSTAKLIVQLGDRDPAIRRAAARVLGEQKGHASDVVPALSGAVQDSDSEVREFAISALGHFGSEAASSLPALEQALGDPELSVRLAAALAIQKIDSHNQSYVPVLIELLRSGPGTVFLEVGQMGADAQWAVPTLIELLSHRQAKTRALAAHALGQIGVAARDAESSLQRSLHDNDPAVCKAAQHALEQIQSKNAGAK